MPPGARLYLHWIERLICTCVLIQPGIIAGDVYVRIKIKKHQTFERRGADLAHIKRISLLEALTGVTIEINHLDGKKHTIATAPGEILHN